MAVGSGQSQLAVSSRSFQLAVAVGCLLFVVPYLKYEIRNTKYEIRSVAGGGSLPFVVYGSLLNI